MKHVFLMVTLLVTLSGVAQETKKGENVIQLTSSVSAEYQPDYFKIFININEYEEVNPNNQQVTRHNIQEVEQSVFKKLEDLGISTNSLTMIDLRENLAMNQNAIYGTANFGNYTNTQKREMAKTYAFQVKTQKEAENVIVALRLNGVINVVVADMLSSENILKLEKQLLELAMQKANEKAQKMGSLIGRKVGAVCAVTEEYQVNFAQDEMFYTNQYYGNNGAMNLGAFKKNMVLKVSYYLE